MAVLDVGIPRYTCVRVCVRACGVDGRAHREIRQRELSVHHAVDRPAVFRESRVEPRQLFIDLGDLGRAGRAGCMGVRCYGRDVSGRGGGLSWLANIS